MTTILITGAAGFIGRAFCRRWADRALLIGVDDLSRPGASWPDCLAPPHERWERDILDIDRLDLPPIDAVVHLAAKVSVTRSISSPLADFRTNAEGTVRLLLAARRLGVARFVYASTNKVFGSLVGCRDPVLDSQPYAPRTPYGVSKAAGALYVRELAPPDGGYVFHQSCIYGDDQAGTVDQGWIAYLRQSVAGGRSIQCFGDGSQVRDLLHVDDLLDAYDIALMGELPPGEYVTGGGAENAVSFDEAVSLIGGRVASYGKWRPHDQAYFVSANEGLVAAGWYSKIQARQWLAEARR